MRARSIRASVWVSKLPLVLLCVAACPLPPEDGQPAIDGGSAGDAGGQQTQVEDLASLLQPILDHSSNPALAAAVGDGQGLLAIGAVGVRKYGDPTPVTSADKWHLGSCTKAMTATLAAVLVDEGLLTWERTLAELFPDLDATMHADYRAVTVEQLLQHRGGTTEWLSQDHPDIWSALWEEGEVTAQRLAFVEALLQLPPAFPPGSEHHYSNAGYMVVGTGLEVLTGESWETLMQERLFGPLEMASCGFGEPASVGQVDQPWGHVGGLTEPEPFPPGPGADNPPALGPAGTVHCALEDWARFARMHLNGARGLSDFVSADSFVRMHTPWSGGDYAFGWGVTSPEWAGGEALTHSGSNTMFYATVWIAPAKDRVLLVATNLANTDALVALTTVTGRLVEIWVP